MPRKTKEDLEKDVKDSTKKSKTSAKTKVNSKVVANPKSKTTSKPKKETKALKEKTTKVKTTKKDVVEKKSSTKKVTEETIKSNTKKATGKTVAIDNVAKKGTTKKPVEKKTAVKAKKEPVKKVAEKKLPAKAKKEPAKKVVEKKTAVKAKKEPVKKIVEKKTAVKAKKEPAKKVVEKKTAVKAKKEPVKKVVEKKTAVKTKKTSAKKAVEKKVTKTRSAKNKNIDIIEYYDLPYRYNRTIVKILAQTPNTLFVYWDISDEDRAHYISQYGEGFFNNTFPVLLVHNKTKNYSFEFEINDFANSWYFNVNDEKCEYVVELGRRPRVHDTFIPDGYLHITSSNIIESPNDHILFEKEQKIVYFRNVTTNLEYSKDIANLNFLKYMGRIYNIYDLYHKIYNDEAMLDLRNPSSRDNPTSRF